MEEQVHQHNPKSELNSLNVKELFFKYIRFLPLFIICIALSLVASYVYLRYSTEIYSTSGKLLIQSDDKNSRATDKLEQVMMSDRMKNVQTEIEVLQSRPLMERVVQALNLNFNLYVQGRFKELNVYKMAAFQIEAINIADSSKSFVLNIEFPDQKSFKVNNDSRVYAFGEVFSNAFGSFKINRVNNATISKECKIIWNPTMNQASSIVTGLEIVPKQNTGILTISMESTNPQLSADIINQLMIEYSKQNIEDKNITTHQQLEFIDKRIAAMSSQLDSINDMYVAFRQQYNLIDPSVQSNALLSKLESGSQAIKEQKIQINQVLQIEDYLNNKALDLTLVPSTLGIQDPTLNALVEEYNRTQQERKELLENAPPGNVMVKQKTEKLNEVKSKILENTKNIRRSFNTVVNSLQSTTGEATSKISTMPAKERELLDIQRDLQSKAIMYNTLLSKREEAAITLASTISSTKILQPSLPNTTPVKPNKGSVRLLALVIGLLLPITIIIAIELLNDKVTSRSDIERLTDATILGEVGHSMGNETLVVTHGNRKVIAEQFRILRSNLQYVLRNVEKPVILVTSSFSGEGKSFISTNVGAVMALTNKKTIILEFDIRKPKILSHLGMPKKPGLSNYLLGKLSVEELPVKVEGYEELYVLPCGPLPPNPSEILLDNKLNDLFDYLRNNFDVIVMDTAPVGMVSDAMTLSKFADCTLYIVRQGHTYKKQIGLIDEYYQEGRLPKISLVLNDVQVRSGYGYYGYGRYGYGNRYGYGYGSGYFDDDKKKNGQASKWFGWLGSKNGVDKKKKRSKA